MISERDCVQEGSRTQSWGLWGEIWAGTSLRALSKYGNGVCGLTSQGQVRGARHGVHLEMKRSSQVGSPCCGGCQPSLRLRAGRKAAGPARCCQICEVREKLQTGFYWNNLDFSVLANTGNFLMVWTKSNISADQF